MVYYIFYSFPLIPHFSSMASFFLPSRLRYASLLLTVGATFVVGYASPQMVVTVSLRSQPSDMAAAVSPHEAKCLQHDLAPHDL